MVNLALITHTHHASVAEGFDKKVQVHRRTGTEEEIRCERTRREIALIGDARVRVRVRVTLQMMAQRLP